MATTQFSIRLDDDVIAEYDDMAFNSKVKRANVIDWALEAYKLFYQANGKRSLTNEDLDEILRFISERARLENSPFQTAKYPTLKAAEDSPHLGKSRAQGDGGGKKTAHG